MLKHLREFLLLTSDRLLDHSFTASIRPLSTVLVSSLTSSYSSSPASWAGMFMEMPIYPQSY